MIALSVTCGDTVSLRLGPAAALICHRHIIHYRGARFARPEGEARRAERYHRRFVPPSPKGKAFSVLFEAGIKRG